MLSIKNATKQYQNGNGIYHIDLELYEGKIYSLVGPNGVGKTTLMKAVAGLLNLDYGEVLLDGVTTLYPKIKYEIGYSLELQSSYSKMTILEMNQFVCEVKYSDRYYEEIELLLRDFELWQSRNKQIRECSLGMKKKLEIVLSFLGNPRLILLDEPTNGVDTSGIIMLKQYILDRKQKNAIILLSSHVLDFVSAISDEIIFLKNGSIRKIVRENDNLEDVYKNLYLE